MNAPRKALAASSFTIGLFALVSTGCVVPADGYGYDSRVSVGIGLDYYEPYGSFYGGGWNSGYYVGPYRGFDNGGYRRDRGRDGPPRSFHPAPGTRPVPTIPSRPRGGRGHGH